MHIKDTLIIRSSKSSKHGCLQKSERGRATLWSCWLRVDAIKLTHKITGVKITFAWIEVQNWYYIPSRIKKIGLWGQVWFSPLRCLDKWPKHNSSILAYGSRPVFTWGQCVSTTTTTFYIMCFIHFLYFLKIFSFNLVCKYFFFCNHKKI